MRRAVPLAALVPLLACGGGATAPLGQLETPVAVAVHQASSRVFVANQGSDELKIFDPTAQGGSGSFELGPAVLFALSIPTVPAPAALGAGDRYVFVLSRDGSEVGFVDLEAADSIGPRSVDGPDGFPITQALPFAPTALAPFAARFPGPEGHGDHALVAGLSSATGGALVAVRPPGAEGTPALVARVELPEGYPADLAVDPSGIDLGLEGAAGPVEDCRAVAIADVRFDRAGTHVPGVWLTRAASTPDGALRIEAVDSPAASRLTVQVPLTLLDGSAVVRSAPVRAAAFVPAPLDDAALAAVAAEPCTLRSGRLVALLDDAYCFDADPRACPDVAMIDLPSGQLSTDLASGPALYTIPGAALGVQVLVGPFSPALSYKPVVDEGLTAAPELTGVPALALVTSADGGVYFFAPGFGTYLRGPAAADRADADRAFALDADDEGPRASPPIRTDAGRRTVPLEAPVIDVAGTSPRDESWTASFLAPLPGLDDLPAPGPDGTLTLPAGADVTFLGPVPVLADTDPARADQLVPRAGTVRCRGYPITAVSADGLTLTVQLVPQDQPACEETGLRHGVVPGPATPWWLAGEVSGFAGRLPPEGGQVWSGGAPLFSFDPPDVPAGEETAPAAGATWRFDTDDGFTRYGAFPDTDFQLPADIDAWLRAPPSATAGADWRVFVPYAGGDALIEFDPEAPPPLSSLRAFQ